MPAVGTLVDAQTDTSNPANAFCRELQQTVFAWTHADISKSSSSLDWQLPDQTCSDENCQRIVTSITCSPSAMCPEVHDEKTQTRIQLPQSFRRSRHRLTFEIVLKLSQSVATDEYLLVGPAFDALHLMYPRLRFNCNRVKLVDRDTIYAFEAELPESNFSKEYAAFTEIKGSSVFPSIFFGQALPEDADQCPSVAHPIMRFTVRDLTPQAPPNALIAKNLAFPYLPASAAVHVHVRFDEQLKRRYYDVAVHDARLEELHQLSFALQKFGGTVRHGLAGWDGFALESSTMQTVQHSRSYADLLAQFPDLDLVSSTPLHEPPVECAAKATRVVPFSNQTVVPLWLDHVERREMLQCVMGVPETKSLLPWSSVKESLVEIAPWGNPENLSHLEILADNLPSDTTLFVYQVQMVDPLVPDRLDACTFKRWLGSLTPARLRPLPQCQIASMSAEPPLRPGRSSSFRQFEARAAVTVPAPAPDTWTYVMVAGEGEPQEKMPQLSLSWRSGTGPGDPAAQHGSDCPSRFDSILLSELPAVRRPRLGQHVFSDTLACGQNDAAFELDDAVFSDFQVVHEIMPSIDGVLPGTKLRATPCDVQHYTKVALFASTQRLDTPCALQRHKGERWLSGRPVCVEPGAFTDVEGLMPKTMEAVVELEEDVWYYALTDVATGTSIHDVPEVCISFDVV
ncbi:hypothetical protein H632_c1137p0 [Helicosporidium sp. ATCC 50920]|nr:hypothetical protein H632_c1137p0 [Helicosporidium sp. ATCC 50920]|eukprot:KDD74682.1 hypothetical protein H632_c1137p0 [Helicosporidium sp. ATCC 50920]